MFAKLGALGAVIYAISIISLTYFSSERYDIRELNIPMAVGIALLAIGCLGQRLGWIAGFAAVLGILPGIFLVGSSLVRLHEVATAVASFLSIVAFGLWGLRARRATALSAAIGGVLGALGGLGGAGLWIVAMINTSGRFPFRDTGVTELIWTATTLSAAAALTLGGTLLLAPAGSPAEAGGAGAGAEG